MRDGDGAARADLLAEPLYHRAGAVEHVAEADHGEDGRAAPHRRALQDHLGEPLARPHHVGRAHGLVGGDQHHELDAVRLGALGDDAAPKVLFHSPQIGFCSTIGTCL